MTEKLNPLDAILTSVERDLKAGLVAAGPTVACELEPTIADFRRITAALLAAVGDWPADMQPDDALRAAYVRTQATKEAEMALQNATTRAAQATHAARDHWRAYLDVQRRLQARAARQRPA